MLTPEQQSRRRGERGNVMIMTAILAVGLVLAVGLCIDGARIYMTRAELQNAADAAALSAARELNGRTGGLDDAYLRAKAIELEANKYGLSRTGGNAPAVTISLVEFAPTLAGPWYEYTGVDSISSEIAATISYVRVTTMTANTPVLFAVRAIGNNHAESRSAVAGMSAPINTICDFFPIAVAYQPDPTNPVNGADGYPKPDTVMSLRFTQGTGNSATLAHQDYIILEVPDITGVGAPETTALSAGLTSICQTLNASVPFHMTPSANMNNGPKQITKGINTRFDCYTCVPGAGPALDPALYPPDSNIQAAITFQQYGDREDGYVTPPPSHPPGQDQRRILIVPIVVPKKYDASNCDQDAPCPNAEIKKWGAFFLKNPATYVNPCNKDTVGCAQLQVEWIDETLVLGRGYYDPGNCPALSTFSVAVLYR